MVCGCWAAGPESANSPFPIGRHAGLRCPFEKVVFFGKGASLFLLICSVRYVHRVLVLTSVARTDVWDHGQATLFATQQPTLLYEYGDFSKLGWSSRANSPVSPVTAPPSIT